MSERPARGPGALPTRTTLGLAVGCGALSLMAFPGLDVWPVAFVSFVPLVVALRGQSAGRAFLLGWTAAFLGKLGAFYWIFGLLEKLGGLPWPVCLLALLLLCAQQAGRFGLHAWLTVRLVERGLPLPLGFAAAFVTSEQVYPLLFPWSFAASVHDVPLLLQSAELGGPIAVGLVLVCANLAAAAPILARIEGCPVDWRRVATWAAVPLGALVFGAWRMAEVDRLVTRAPTARLGVVQANMLPGDKEASPDEGLRRHVELTEALQRQGPLDLVIWSETSLARPLWESEVAPWVATRFATRLGVPLLFGAVLARPVADARRHVTFNTALLTDQRGAIVDRYDKQRLMPFSELLPLGHRLPMLYRWFPRGARGQPSAAGHALRLGQIEAATMICYEDILPAHVNGLVRPGSTSLIVNLTNDAWFGDTSEPWIHLALSRLRAVEHRRYFVRGTNTGISAVIDPVGRLAVRTPLFVEASRVVDIRLLPESRTLYEACGDGPWWLVSAVCLLAAVVRRTPTYSRGAAAG